MYNDDSIHGESISAVGATRASTRLNWGHLLPAGLAAPHICMQDISARHICMQGISAYLLKISACTSQFLSVGGRSLFLEVASKSELSSLIRGGPVHVSDCHFLAFRVQPFPCYPIQPYNSCWNNRIAPHVSLQFFNNLSLHSAQFNWFLCNNIFCVWP